LLGVFPVQVPAVGQFVVPQLVPESLLLQVVPLMHSWQALVGFTSRKA
jgi:hypothetical protein